MKNDFEILRKDMINSLKIGEPTLVLDRLHTFSVKYIKKICIEHNIDIKDSKNNYYTLFSMFGMLIKFYSTNNIITKFSETVMKSSISVFEKFNDIRNNKSFAHDNDIITNSEALFIIKSITNILEFIDYIETGDSNDVCNLVVPEKEDIYKLICIKDIISTKEIAEYFNCRVDDIIPLILELYKVDSTIKRNCITDNELDENCNWIKNSYC